MSSKADLRKAILLKRDNLSPLQRKTKSEIIINSLRNLIPYQKSQHPMFYASFRSEVYTLDIIKERIDNGLSVILPKTNISERRLIPYEIHSWSQDIKIGAYGIFEPDPRNAKAISPTKLDLIIVPGSVFDETCARHGYGGGFYDRFLSLDAPQALRIGLAFSCQIVQKAPSEPHDQKMDVVITEDRILNCGSPT